MLRRLRRREIAFVGSWPAAFGRWYLRARVNGKLPRDASPPREHEDVPYWLELPGYLAQVYALRPSFHDRDGNTFLTDVAWGQYCLVLFLRLQDDLVDGDVTGGTMLFAADQYLIEAHRVFAVHMRRADWFWRMVREALDASVRAWARAERLQRRPGASGGALLEEYGRMGAVFTIGAAAVCARARRRADLTLVQAFSARMCIAAQVLDDLTDLLEDLRRQRVNYVAKTLLRSARHASTAAIARRVPSEIVAGDGAMRIYDVARHHLLEAQGVAKELQCPPLERYVKSQLVSVDAARAHFERTRVAAMLGPLLTPPSSLVRRRARDRMRTPAPLPAGERASRRETPRAGRGRSR